MTNKDILDIKRLASYVENGSINEDNISILDALDGNKFRNNYSRPNDWGLDLGSIAQSLSEDSSGNAQENKNKVVNKNKSYQVRKKPVVKTPQPMKKPKDVEIELKKREEEIRKNAVNNEVEDEDYIDF